METVSYNIVSLAECPGRTIETGRFGVDGQGVASFGESLQSGKPGTGVHRNIYERLDLANRGEVTEKVCLIISLPWTRRK